MILRNRIDMEKRLSIIIWLALAILMVYLKCDGFSAPVHSKEYSSSNSSVSFRKAPYIIFSGDRTQMDILWQLDTTAASTISWGVDTTYGWGSTQTSEYDNDHQHKFALSELIPGMRYCYRVSVGNESYKGLFYAAPWPSMARITFFVYGDTRMNPDIHDKVANKIVSTFPLNYKNQSFIISVGDLVDDGNDERDWDDQFFNRSLSNIQKMLANIPYQSVMGNHEGKGELFTKYFPYPYISNRYWSFDYGSAHFVMLDQYTPYDSGSAQLEWIQKDLFSSDRPWKFIVLHEPGWSAGGEHKNNLDVQRYIQPLCVKYGVPIVFSGHCHYYARAVVDGVEHITTGGGGAPLHKPHPDYPNVVATAAENHFCKVDIFGTRLHFAAIALDGTIIDSFSIRINQH